MVDERKYKAASFLIQLLSHLLLYAYWNHPYYLPHWTDEIDNFRLEFAIELAVSLSGNLQSCLRTAWLLLSKSTGKSESKSGLTLPVDCPCTIEKILDEDWLPG
ncbi:MAG: DUF29 family protein [Microcystis aeruginosa Ma_MB_F_20061100_S20]|uniref:DUF29 family protein n=1 Tax=Microcystis aeruginosa Ma_MB_F_20061100_S20D TaxID=2486253 RepID=A0A552EUZ4_MICAE|nr:MAG: DUF29 family protein [Microcystis aeruginosa Ma_MB_F_20061100_S20]TRU38284.1 MAG: DUF29 family protein [Microcystis aeruginosa Ma_MB_F_20061100_S20D]